MGALFSTWARGPCQIATDMDVHMHPGWHVSALTYICIHTYLCTIHVYVYRIYLFRDVPRQINIVCRHVWGHAFQDIRGPQNHSKSSRDQQKWLDSIDSSLICNESFRWSTWFGVSMCFICLRPWAGERGSPSTHLRPATYCFCGKSWGGNALPDLDDSNQSKSKSLPT